MSIKDILLSTSPSDAIKELYSTNKLYDTFKFPNGFLEWDMNQNNPWHKLNVFEHSLEALSNVMHLAKMMTASDDFLLRAAALLHDTGKLNPKCHGTKVRGGVITNTYIGHEHHSVYAAEHILRHDGVQQDEIDRVKTIISGAGRVNPGFVPPNETCPMSQRAVGRFIRFTNIDWKNAIIVSMADASGKDKGILNTFDFTYHTSMISKIIEANPDKIISLRPALDLTEIQNIIMCDDVEAKRIQDKVMDWQLGNDKWNVKQAINYVKTFKRND